MFGDTVLVCMGDAKCLLDNIVLVDPVTLSLANMT